MNTDENSMFSSTLDACLYVLLLMVSPFMGIVFELRKPTGQLFFMVIIGSLAQLNEVRQVLSKATHIKMCRQTIRIAYVMLVTLLTTVVVCFFQFADKYNTILSIGNTAKKPQGYSILEMIPAILLLLAYSCVVYESLITFRRGYKYRINVGNEAINNCNEAPNNNGVIAKGGGMV